MFVESNVIRGFTKIRIRVIELARYPLERI
jgi:hypothetical protein